VNFFLELAEWSSVGRFVLFQELQHLLDSLRAKLLADGDEVLGLVSPEVDLGDGVWVLSVLQSALWVSLQDLLDLLRPVDDGTFEQLGFVLAGSLLTRGHIIWWKGKECSSFHLADGDVGVSEETVELVHEILGHEVGPPKHVEWVAHDWHEDLVTDQVEVLQDLLVQFHEDDLFLDVGHGDLERLWGGLWRSGSQAENNLLLHCCWWVSKVTDWGTGGVLHCEKVEKSSFFGQKVIDCFLVVIA